MLGHEIQGENELLELPTGKIPGYPEFVLIWGGGQAQIIVSAGVCKYVLSVEVGEW